MKRAHMLARMQGGYLSHLQAAVRHLALQLLRLA